MATTDLLVTPDWLRARLGDPSVRIVDASVDIVPRPPGPSDYLSRREQYLDAHIPGADYLHMVDDLSDPAGTAPFTLLPPERVWERLSTLGIRSGDTVVVYGNRVHWASHRCWWVLAVAGADVRLLDASFEHWVATGGPVEAGAPDPAPGSRFVGRPNLDWVADTADVVASLDEPSVALVNALSREQFAGRGQPFGRAGRIPGSISVPAAELVDAASGGFRARRRLRQSFEAAGAGSYERLITYCGGGIAASTSFFALRLLGFDNVALYDGSLLAWSADPDLPLIVD